MKNEQLQANSVSPERLAELNTRWDQSLKRMSHTLYPASSPESSPMETLAAASQAAFERDPEKRLLIGIAGPGAAGKGTLSAHLVDTLGFAKVVNTTTREKREKEIEGIDYYFMDHSQFTLTQNLGKFALALSRPNRGLYGITHEEIERKLSSSPHGCIVEENSANIMKLFADTTSPDIQQVLLYIFPSPPIIQSSLRRLEHRLSHEADPAKRIITPELVESTLGDRQIDEFDALTGLVNQSAIAPLFIINDNLADTKSYVTHTLGGSNASSS